MTVGSETQSPLAAAFRGWGAPAAHALRIVLILVGILVVAQSFWMVQARPQDLITGIFGMADFLRRASPPGQGPRPTAVTKSSAQTRSGTTRAQPMMPRARK